MVPQKKKVRVITDSEVAITSLTEKKKKIQGKQWIRETNYDIKRSIAEIASLKEIDLELVKIKGHSGNRWNSRADMLAKLGSKLDSKNNIDRILDRPPESSNVSLYWKDKIVEIPTRKFLKEILDIKTGAE